MFDDDDTTHVPWLCVCALSFAQQNVAKEPKITLISSCSSVMNRKCYVCDKDAQIANLVHHVNVNARHVRRYTKEGSSKIAYSTHFCTSLNSCLINFTDYSSFYSIVSLYAMLEFSSYFSISCSVWCWCFQNHLILSSSTSS